MTRARFGRGGVALGQARATNDAGSEAGRPHARACARRTWPTALVAPF